VRHVDPDRAFFGEPNKLRFVSSFVPQGQYGGLWRYEIALEAGEGATALVLTQQLIRTASSAVGPPLGTVVLKEMRALSVRYFGGEDKDKAPQWRDTCGDISTACCVSFPRTSRLLDLDRGQRWS
jgi:hypothetical protein